MQSDETYESHARILYARMRDYRWFVGGERDEAGRRLIVDAHDVAATLADPPEVWIGLRVEVRRLAYGRFTRMLRK